MMFDSKISGLEIFIITLASLVVAYLKIKSTRIPKGLRLPPGPRGKPFIGNLLDMPTHPEWETVTKWGEKYGDLVFVKPLGIPMVFVNSAHVARDLFDKRSSLYSDRHRFPMLMMMGWEFNFVLMHYGEWWRRHRSLFHEYFHPNVIAPYHPIQARHTRVLLRNLCESPENFFKHLKYHSGGIILEIIFGIKIKHSGDPYIEVAERALRYIEEAAVPGRFLVDLFPILEYIPEWMPGAGFKRQARIWRKYTDEMYEGPFKVVKDAFSAGTATPCVLLSMLQQLSNQGDAPTDEIDVIQNTAAIAYAAGEATTASALINFILAMVLYPNVQKTAQAELDRVIGTDRLPEIDDLNNLPYIRALCMEVHRWRQVVPLGMPHRLMEDDVYGEYFIPKGTIVMGNAWAMLHNEKIYGPRPECFEPERFLVPGVHIPNAQFGFGRRICPGRFMAENLIFITIASILQAFTISHVIDANGNEVPVDGDYTPGAVVQPMPFQCSIKLRSQSAEKLIQQIDD